MLQGICGFEEFVAVNFGGFSGAEFLAEIPSWPHSKQTEEET
jgi:hypothetical protein